MNAWFSWTVQLEREDLREKGWKILSYSPSNPVKKALLPLTRKHFDASFWK